MIKIKKNSALRLNFETGIDDALTSDVRLYVRDPAGDESYIESADIIVDTAATGSYYTDIATDFFNLVGQWKFWSFIATADGDYSGETITVIVEPVGVGIVSREFVKGWLGITDTSEDSAIELIIPYVEQAYLNIRNAPWDKDPEGNIIYPKGSDMTAAEMVGFKLQTSYGKKRDRDVQSEKIGSYSVSFGGSSSESSSSWGFPKSITSTIKRYINMGDEYDY